ncbi:hypothetical protein LF1_26050 [Rubripirellula obstinata]|uniref:Uncharacterized protein n=1 Tax=Rubripirellula obstinata TaxID=406547 RepID=A0A5B1CHN6_9BACT|nr:hypothetical protein LF1_26050 [Rubripirellula obstinata]
MGIAPRREGLLNRLTAWASPRASTRNETRGAMPNAAKQTYLPLFSSNVNIMIASGGMFSSMLYLRP